MFANPQGKTVATIDEQSLPLAQYELEALGGTIEQLAPGVLLLGNLAFPFAAEKARSGEIVFVRHLFPVQFECNAQISTEALGELFSALKVCSPYTSFAAQVRCLDQSLTKEQSIAASRAIEGCIFRVGGEISRKNPLTVGSLVVVAGKIIGGVSDTQSNLSSWPGGAIRLRSDDQQISSAEHKLVEALEVFGLAVWSGQRALDLGASPGGWTRVLLERSVSVTAVDPAPLDARLKGKRGLEYLASTTEQFLGREGRTRAGSFDLLLNDMRMDPLPSARLMVESAGLLSPKGIGVLTLKLPEQSVEQTFSTLQQAKVILGEAFKIQGMCQLFHNRSEVTVALSKRDRAQ